MKPPPLQTRIRNGTLLMLALTLAIGAFAVPAIHKLGGAIRETLYRNYRSIEAAQQMHTALYAVELGQLQGNLTAVLAQNRGSFAHWINAELNDITEIGEDALAKDIQVRGQRIFGELSRGLPGTPGRQEFAILHHRLDELIEMNQAAMFRANSRTMRMGDRLASEFAIALVILLLFGVVLSWTLARNISKPLTELSDRLRSFSLRGPSPRLGQQPIAELQAVGSEFNRMAQRLEQFEKLNVDRLIYEKSKTEAILESIEDGIVLIDSDGVITHINELASIILSVEREEALGSYFDDLSSNHPHYLRVRSALRRIAKEPLESQRVEVELHVRGRDHIYVLKSVPLRQDGQSFGTILILQDITYLRSKEQARTNLVATLSHEIKTPLTSLALSAQLLQRSRSLSEQQQELVTAIDEDVGRLKDLANELLDLARGTAAAITLKTVPVDIGYLLQAVTRTFALQAEQKRVMLTTEFDDSAPKICADPIKLSWVVSNLIANALRYTPVDGVIALSAKMTPPVVHLQVRDTGPGIAPQIQERLFERFAQWNTNGAEPGSSGLGLAIAKEIVQAHGGRIFVDSTLGKGTCFTVELPTGDDAL
jgi:two-component system, NtrC family, sensor histidine kinase KinB